MLQQLNLNSFEYLEKGDKERFINNLHRAAYGEQEPNKENDTLDRSGLNKLKDKFT